MKNYIKLSEGEYSDYTPNYFCGDIVITQEEMDKKGKEIGDKIYDWFENLPKRPHPPCVYGCFSWCKKEEPVDENGKVVYSGSLAEKWFKEMREWVKEKGYEEVPEDVPEINVSYSEIPHSGERKRY